jgi:orotidine-5'-phosphate decarboxylase
VHALLKEKITAAGHPVCIGFDPDITDLHPFLKRQFEGLAVESFLERWYAAVVTPIAKQAHSIKFQSAFFEQFGPIGLTALRDVIIDAKKRGLFVILDAKRGDISSTMSAYGRMAFDAYQADALTIMPWMGTDSLMAIMPWLKQGRGAFLVWLSSNPSGRAIQMKEFVNQSSPALEVFSQFYDRALSESVTQQLGWVLGATSIPDGLMERLPSGEHCFLLPGIGAQGAVFDATTTGIAARHPSSLFPVSRGILKPDPASTIHSWDEYSLFVTSRWQQLITAYKTERSK